MKEVEKYPHCFVCGDQNACGLKARFFFDGAQVVTEFIADERFEGYQGICHGGITATVLDEVMVKVAIALNIFATTAEMTVRYLQPVRVGDHITCRGRVVSRKGRACFTEAEAVRSDGSVVATATGKYIEAKEEFRGELMQSLK